MSIGIALESDGIRALHDAGPAGLHVKELHEKLHPGEGGANLKSLSGTGQLLAHLHRLGFVSVLNGRKPKHCLSAEGLAQYRRISTPREAGVEWSGSPPAPTAPVGMGAPAPAPAANDAVVQALLQQNRELMGQIAEQGRQLAELNARLQTQANAPPQAPPPAPAASTPAHRTIELAQVIETLPKLLGKDSARALTETLVRTTFGLGAPTAPPAAAEVPDQADKDDGLPYEIVDTGFKWDDGSAIRFAKSKEDGGFHPVGFVMANKDGLATKAKELAMAIAMGIGQRQQGVQTLGTPQAKAAAPQASGSGWDPPPHGANGHAQTNGAPAQENKGGSGWE
jgi:hypothetical protein